MKRQRNPEDKENQMGSLNLSRIYSDSSNSLDKEQIKEDIRTIETSLENLSPVLRNQRIKNK